MSPRQLLLIVGGMLALFWLCAPLALAARPAEAPLWVFVGTYTGGESQGIYRLELDPATGALSEPQLAAEMSNPSFLAIHPDHTFLYAVSEVSATSGEPGGSVVGFALDAGTGALTPLNRQSSRGAGPCHLVVDHQGKNVLVANYGGGSIAALPIGADGRLQPASAFVQHEGSGANPKRQEAPHAHSIHADPADRFAIAADLGLDQLRIYRFDPSNGTLTPNDPPATSTAPGSGPRHFAFHPDGRHAYVINELNSTVTAFDYDPSKGTLTEIQTVPTLAQDDNASKNYPAEVQVHPSGRFLYGSNRGKDSIAVFAIDADSGRLRPLQFPSTGGNNPRNFGIDPSGRFLLAANQDSNNIVVFRIDPKTGELQPTGQEVHVPRPVCVKMIRKGE